jgi:hypothetical protein
LRRKSRREQLVAQEPQPPEAVTGPELAEHADADREQRDEHREALDRTGGAGAADEPQGEPDHDPERRDLERDLQRVVAGEDRLERVRHRGRRV